MPKLISTTYILLASVVSFSIQIFWTKKINGANLVVTFQVKILVWLVFWEDFKVSSVSVNILITKNIITVQSKWHLSRVRNFQSRVAKNLVT